MAHPVVLSWRGRAPWSLEQCQVDDRRLRGCILRPHGGLFYGVDWDGRGCVRRVRVETTDGRRVALDADGRGAWREAGAVRSDLAGCIDVDLSATPATNSLPIWRVGWCDGIPRRFAMCWIDADTLQARRDDQIYTRLDASHFRYQSADGAFERVIEVDGDGLVTIYPDLFARA